MFNQGDEDEGHIFGSALNPATLHGKGDKPLAKPGVKVEVKANNRSTTGGAIMTEAEKAEKEQTEKEQGKDIWTEEEVDIAAEERPDDRP